MQRIALWDCWQKVVNMSWTLLFSFLYDIQGVISDKSQLLIHQLIPVFLFSHFSQSLLSYTDKKT